MFSFYIYNYTSGHYSVTFYIVEFTQLWHFDSLASHTLTHERGSGQAAIVELCNLDGFDDVTSSGATRCDQVIAIS